MMKINELNVEGMEALSLSECRQITGGETTVKCITGSDGSTVRVERTVDANGHVTIKAVNDPFCRIGGTTAKK